MSSELVFVDTSAWVALLSSGDSNHSTAKEFWKQLRESRRGVVTSDYVLDETYTLLRRGRGGLPMAVAFHDLIEASRVIQVIQVDKDLQRRAWELFVGYEDKSLSFTACVSFALMREGELLEAFAFDDDFRRAGLVVKPG